jgi:membrane complex biogenesis BtpA family protein
MPFSFAAAFGQLKPLVAMIHVPALPGTPAYAGDWPAVLAHVTAEATLLRDLGVDALLLENMHDTPYLARTVGPEIVAAMTAVALAVRRTAPNLPCGLQILAGANQAALAVALAADLAFIRAEGFVFSHVADEGWMDSDAGALLRYRRMVGADHIAIFTDIKKKHSAHSVTADVSLAETAKAAEFFRTDGLIVTGIATGQPAQLADLVAVKRACPALPLLVGSGVTTDNAADYKAVADACIIGSALKVDGHWANAIDPQRVSDLVSVWK